MATPGRKFSFTRFMLNAFPNSANDAKDDVDLKPELADLLFRYQLSLPQPRYLGPLSFKMAGITDSDSISRKVHRNLIKHSIIAPAPGDKEQVSGINPPLTERVPGNSVMTVNTSLLGKSLPSQVAVISVHAQRRLIGMLFFWEEECVRWKLLDEEEQLLEAAIEGERLAELNDRGGDGRENDLEVRLKGIRMRMRLVPSERGESTANVSRGRGHELPDYSRE